MIVRKRKLRRALAAGCLLREETLRLSHATLVRSSLNLVIAFQCKIFEHTLGQPRPIDMVKSHGTLGPLKKQPVHCILME